MNYNFDVHRSLIGAIGVIFGLYVVLWGKAEDHVEIDAKKETEEQNTDHKILIAESLDKTSCEIDLEEPLLSNKMTPDLKDDQKN